MYKCKNCGSLFISPDSFYHSDFDYSISVCPDCNSTDYETVSECAVCGSMRCESELVNDVCKDCLDKACTPETAIRIGTECTESVEINGFYAYLFGAERINQILANHAVNTPERILQEDAKRYVLDDPWCTAEYLKTASKSEQQEPGPVRFRKYIPIRRKKA